MPTGNKHRFSEKACRITGLCPHPRQMRDPLPEALPQPLQPDTHLPFATLALHDCLDPLLHGLRDAPGHFQHVLHHRLLPFGCRAERRQRRPKRFRLLLPGLPP